MAKQTSSAPLRKVKHDVPGDYYHCECQECDVENVVLVINRGRVVVKSTVCPNCMAMGQSERDARLPKNILAEIEALIAAKPEPEPDPIFPPVIPGAEDGPNFFVEPDTLTSQEFTDGKA